MQQARTAATRSSDLTRTDALVGIRRSPPSLRRSPHSHLRRARTRTSSAAQSSLAMWPSALLFARTSSSGLSARAAAMQRVAAIFAESKSKYGDVVPTRLMPPSWRRDLEHERAKMARAAKAAAGPAANATAASTASSAAATAAVSTTARSVPSPSSWSGSSPAFTAAPSSSPVTSISDRTVRSAVDEMHDMLHQQASIVQPHDPHAANIVILGTPNAGKSTLVNRLVGQKISAVSHKKHTTFTSVLGVATKENRQLVLFDTPGVLPKAEAKKFVKELTTAAWNAALGCDVAVVIVDVVKRLSDAEFELFERAKNLVESSPSMRLILVLNKMDLAKPAARAHAVAEKLQTLAPFSHTFYMSLEKDKGVNKLADFLYGSCLPREWEHASNAATDLSLPARVNEIIREKIFHRVHQEIPYRVVVSNEGWTVLPDGTTRIDVALMVDTKNQKKILAGPGGSMLTFITHRALPEVQALVGPKVVLFLKVYSRK